MKRIARNKLLIWVIALGLLNFAVYTFFYWYFQGDARNGFIRDGEYFLRGHFLRFRMGQTTAPVARGIWIYSFIHSISIWPTIGAVLASMFVLARPHIIATMKADSLLSGKTFTNACLVIVVAVVLVATVVFSIDLVQALDAAVAGRDYGN